MDYRLINDIAARSQLEWLLDISEDEAKRIAESVDTEKQFVDVWENQVWWTDEHQAKTFRIWFKDGSTVSETWGGQNIISSIKELYELAKQYRFAADEVLNNGETEMLEEGVVIGGVVTE